jgi:hypothetical protein
MGARGERPVRLRRGSRALGEVRPPLRLGPQNCARPGHSFVKDSTLRMVMRYRSSGDCGPGSYSAGMKLAERFESVDQKISVRFRVRSVDGIRVHRIIPMRWPSSDHGSNLGEEDYCEDSSLRGCMTFLHHSDGQECHQYWVNLTGWHSMTFVRRNFTLRAFIDGKRRWVYHGTNATLPPTLKRPVLQQECRSGGCPDGKRARGHHDQLDQGVEPGVLTPVDIPGRFVTASQAPRVTKRSVTSATNTTVSATP